MVSPTKMNLMNMDKKLVHGQGDSWMACGEGTRIIHGHLVAPEVTNRLNMDIANPGRIEGQK